MQAAILVLLTAIVYAPVLGASFIWDDELLTQNRVINAPNGVWLFWFTTDVPDYFPVTYSMFWVEWRMWGANPDGYHVVNVLLHIANAFLLWGVLERLEISGAWLAALLFAVHPVAAGSVLWVAERKNTLSLFFALLTLLGWLRFERRQTVWNYAVPLLAFACALLSKSAIVMLPAVLLLCAWWQRGKIEARDLVRTTPFFALSLLAGIVTIWFQEHRAIATEVIAMGSPAVRVATAGYAFWFYLFKVFAPFGLTMIYPSWHIDPASVASYLPTLSLLLVPLALWQVKRRWSEGVLFALGCFLLGLLPSLGLVKMLWIKFSPVADHFQYAAMPAVIALAGAGVVSAGKRVPRPVRMGFVCLLVAGLCVLTRGRVHVFHEPVSLWRDVIAKNPTAWAAYGNLGDLAQRDRNDPVAIACYERLTQLKPDAVTGHLHLAEIYGNEGRTGEQIAHLREALRYAPDDVSALNGLAWLLATKPAFRHGDEALELAKRACVLTNQRDAATLDTLAVACADAGNFSAAVAITTQILAHPGAHLDRHLAAEIQAHLDSFRVGQAIREP